MSLGEGGSVRTDGRERDRWRPLLPGCVEKTVTCVRERQRGRALSANDLGVPDKYIHVFPADES